MSTADSSSNRDMSAGTARVSLPLCSNPYSRIVIPVVARVSDAPQRWFDIVPPTLVFDASLDQLGDEGTPATRPYPFVEISDEIVVQLNV